MRKVLAFAVVATATLGIGFAGTTVNCGRRSACCFGTGRRRGFGCRGSESGQFGSGAFGPTGLLPAFVK